MSIIHWKSRKRRALLVLARQVCHHTRYDGQHHLEHLERDALEKEGKQGRRTA